jgi:hypothetical protein
VVKRQNLQNEAEFLFKTQQRLLAAEERSTAARRQPFALLHLRMATGGVCCGQKRLVGSWSENEMRLVEYSSFTAC